MNVVKVIILYYYSNKTYTTTVGVIYEVRVISTSFNNSGVKVIKIL